MKEFPSKEQIETIPEAAKKEEIPIEKTGEPPEILDIKKERRQLSGKLREQLAQTEKGEKIFEQGKPVARYDENKKMFIVEQSGKKPQVATFGDLITDASWGLEYNLDKSAPKEIKRAYIIESVKQKLADLYDRQLIIEQIEKKEVHHYKKEVYQRIQERTEKEFEHSAGLLFEKILKNLLRQVQQDLPDLGIKIKDANVMKDVEYKIDFIIQVKKHQRGAEIEEIDPEKITKPAVLGIQFTLIRPSEPDFEKKLRQCQIAKKHLDELKIDDLILISLPTSKSEVVYKYRAWKELGKPVGGPEKLYDTSTKIIILKKVLQKMGIDDLLENQETRLKEYYDSKLKQIA